MWDFPIQLDPNTIDVSRYKELALRAAYEVLQPIGITETILRDWLFSNAGYITKPGELSSDNSSRLALPLFAELKSLHKV